MVTGLPDCVVSWKIFRLLSLILHLHLEANNRVLMDIYKRRCSLICLRLILNSPIWQRKGIASVDFTVAFRVNYGINPSVSLSNSCQESFSFTTLGRTKKKNNNIFFSCVYIFRSAKKKKCLRSCRGGGRTQ